MHPSLLPRWRGAAPIERAIEAGDDETGVTIMRPVAELDAGPICLQRAEPMDPHDDFGALAPARSAGGELLVEALDLRPPCREQPAEGVTFAAKIEPGDRLLEPALMPDELERHVRALSPQSAPTSRCPGASAWGWCASAWPGGGARAGRPRGPRRAARVRGNGRRPRADRGASGRKAPMDAGAWLRGNGAARLAFGPMRAGDDRIDLGPSARPAASRGCAAESGGPLPLRLLPAPVRTSLGCPNCGAHSTIARMSDTANVICRSCGGSMLQEI